MGRKKNKHLPKKGLSKDTVQTTYEKTTETMKLLNINTPNTEAVEANVKLEEVALKDGQLIFKKCSERSERVHGREYFVHSLCQMCKRDLRERFPCVKCSLVNYCSVDHRRLHWPEHAELCVAVQAVCQSRGETHILQRGLHLQPEPFRVLRYRNMLDCEDKVQRPLERWEKEVFIFPNVCGNCHQYKIQSLIVCELCNHCGFCEGHRTENHDEWCAHLVKYKLLVRDQNKFGIICPKIPISEIASFLPKLSHMNNTFKDIRNYYNELEFLELTELVTYPLTALYVLLTLNNVQSLNFDKLVIHVVGAEREFEINKLEKWEYYVLHLIPTMRNLVVEFIGPELGNGTVPNSYNVCHDCFTAKKTVTFGFQNQLYHNLTKTPNFSRPDLICVFNPGLYRTTGFDGLDTWSPSIVSMFSQNCPVLTTSYTKKEVYLDVERVKTIENVKILQEPSLNQFSSLKPSLNFVSDEDSPVIFKNQFLCVMHKA